MAGLDVAAGIVGIVSLGLTCCHGIVKYYGAYKDFDSNMKRMFDSTQNCQHMLETISSIPINTGTFTDQARLDMEICIHSCDDALKEVKRTLDRLNPADKEGLGSSVKTLRRFYNKSKFSLKESTITSVWEYMDSTKEDLARALQLVQM
jgi:hypothetical protein